MANIQIKVFFLWIIDIWLQRLALFLDGILCLKSMQQRDICLY